MDPHKEEGHAGQNNLFHIFYIHAGNGRLFTHQILLSNCGIQGAGSGMEDTVMNKAVTDPARWCLHSGRKSRH